MSKFLYANNLQNLCNPFPNVRGFPKAKNDQNLTESGSRH